MTLVASFAFAHVMESGGIAGSWFDVQAAVDSTDGAVEAQLLEMIRSGSHPLHAYGIPAQIPKLSAVLAKVLQSCQLQFGSYKTTNPNK